MLANCRECFTLLDKVIQEGDEVICKNNHKTTVRYIKCRYCGLYSTLIGWSGLCQGCQEGLGEGKKSYFI